MQFFSRLYRYTQSGSKENQENFLTEILCGCLNLDSIFHQSFLKSAGIKDGFQRISAITQFRHDRGIPDIFITIDDDTAIIVECKIAARRRETQLERYSQILKDTGRSNLYLIYLTRSNEIIEHIPSDVLFVPMLWNEVAALARMSPQPITTELNNYLIELGMSNQINFNLSQLTILKEYDEFVETAEHFLSKVKIRLKEHGVKKIQKDKLVDDSYVGINFKYFDLPLWVGFFQYYPKYRETQFGLSCEGVRKNLTNYQVIAKGFDALHFEHYDVDNDKSVIFHLNRDLSTFFEGDVFQTDTAIGFIEEQLVAIRRFMS